MDSRNVLLYGSPEPLPRVTPLRAGPVELLFDNGALRYLRVGGREAVRRIAVAVRDPDWGTVPARISALKIAADRDQFQVTFVAEHEAAPIRFRWHARIDGTPDGTVRYQMDGQALSTFRRNRIGLFVIHPTEGFAGHEIEIETTDGERKAGVVPVAVSPHQVFRQIRAIFHEIAPGCRAEVRFEGETFEMEDHRNWTDSGFKTYGTPLSLPFPVEVPRGTVIRQQVIFRIHGTPPRAASFITGRPVAEIRIEGGARRMPELGLSLSTEEAPEERLHALRLSHLRVAAGQTVSAAAARLPLEVVILAGADPEPQMREALEWAREHRLTVACWALLSSSHPVTPDAWSRLARKILAGAPLAGGTRGHFAELNRNRPKPGAFDAVCFAVCPQVHDSDNTALMENCAAQRDAVASALAFAPAVYASPVTLRPQFNPVATGPQKPPAPDPRQGSLFCAAWTVASLKHLAEAGAAGITLFETAGAAGVMTRGRVFPVWHVLADSGEFRGGEVLPSLSSEPLAVECLALRAGRRRRLLAANLTPVEQRLRWPGAARVRLLDARSAEEAMSDPDRFRGRWQEAAGERGLTLDAYAVATLDLKEEAR